MDATRTASMGMSASLRDVALAAQAMTGFAATSPDTQRVRVEALDAQRGAVASTPAGGVPTRVSPPAVEPYRLPVGASVGLDPDLVQQFMPLSTDGLDVTQGMAAIIVGRQAFQANRAAYQAAQALLDSTLKVGL